MTLQIRQDYRKQLVNFSREGLLKLQETGYSGRIELGSETRYRDCGKGHRHPVETGFYFENGYLHSCGFVLIKHRYDATSFVDERKVGIDDVPFEKLDENGLLSLAERVENALLDAYRNTLIPSVFTTE